MSAFQDFGPLTERRRAEKQRQQRRRLMIAGGTVSVIIVLVVMGGAAVVYNEKQGSHKAGSKGSSSSTTSSGSGPPSSMHSVSKSIKMICAQTDYKDTCEKSIGKATNASTTSPKDFIRAAVEVIGEEIGKGFERSGLIDSDDPRVKAAVADCKEIFEDAKADLARTLKGIDADSMEQLAKQGYQLRVWLSAVIAHQETCIDGFPEGELKTKMKEAMKAGRQVTSNALAIIQNASSFLSALHIPGFSRRLLAEGEAAPAGVAEQAAKDGVPAWVSKKDRRLLKGRFKNNLAPNAIVAKDGSGKFKTINEALTAMPKTYTGRYVIYVKEGVYEEYVTITKSMVNVTVYGDGAKKTIVSGSKNFVDGLTTFKTATFTAQGDGFMAIAMGFRNTAGAAKHQAVALLVQSDRSIFLNCRMDAYQDTLYAHSKSQFYRNCVISGTIDFVFGDAAAVFQNCILVLRRPLDNQQNIATAQGRADGREATGFVLQHCRFTAETALKDASRPVIRNYLGRPWREYSRTLIMESDIPAFIHKDGFLPWNGDFALKTLWYAEYANTGPGADTSARVSWPGYKVIKKDEASKFTVTTFLHGEPWIKPTGTPVRYGLWV